MKSSIPPKYTSEAYAAANGPVTSVHGRTGAVAAVNGDYQASKVTNDSSVSGATVKDALNSLGSAIAGSGNGDVVGPAGSTDNAIARFNGTTGKSIQNSGVLIDDYDTMKVKATYSDIVVATWESSVEFDLRAGNVQQLTLSGGPTTFSLANVKVGQRFLIILLQDATGSRTVNWFGGITSTMPALTTTANKADVFGFICTAVGVYRGGRLFAGV